MTHPDPLSFFCQGNAVAQPRGRAFALPGGHIRVASAKRDHPVHKWKEALRSDAQAAMAGRSRFEGAIALELSFLMERPKSMPKKTKDKIVPHTSRPDLDNLEKAVKDALTSIVWKDDSQVSAVAKRKRYVRGAEVPGVHILVAEDFCDDIPF